MLKVTRSTEGLTLEIKVPPVIVTDKIDGATSISGAELFKRIQLIANEVSNKFINDIADILFKPVNIEEAPKVEEVKIEEKKEESK